MISKVRSIEKLNGPFLILIGWGLWKAKQAFSFTVTYETPQPASQPYLRKF